MLSPASTTFRWPEYHRLVAGRLTGIPAAVIVFSHYPWDPRVRRETEAMAEAGMQIDLFCLRENDRQPVREVVNGVKVTRLNLRRSHGGKLRYVFEYLFFFLWGFWHLSLAGLRKRYRIVHVHNMPDLLVFTSLVPRLRGARIILDLHDPMPELFQTIYGLGPRHWLVRFLTFTEQLSARYADIVLTPNVGFRELFVWRTKLDKFNVVMNSPSDDIFQTRKGATGSLLEFPGPNRPFRLMYHGLIAERHGLDILLRAVKIVAADLPWIQLDIYGAETPYLETVCELITEMQLESRVHYHGKKSLSEIAAIIETIDLGVVPNRRTPFTELNFPTRIFEYLALKKPVIALNTAGVRDYFGANEIFFLESDDPVALARTIRSIHDNPAQTRQVTQRGYEVYCRHRWSGERERFLGLVAQLLVTSQTLFG